MRFYNQQHKFYCGIDLHARKMYVCIIDQKGKTRVHENLKTDPEALFDIIFPFLEDVVICSLGAGSPVDSDSIACPITYIPLNCKLKSINSDPKASV